MYTRIFKTGSEIPPLLSKVQNMDAKGYVIIGRYPLGESYSLELVYDDITFDEKENAPENSSENSPPRRDNGPFPLKLLLRLRLSRVSPSRSLSHNLCLAHFYFFFQLPA